MGSDPVNGAQLVAAVAFLIIAASASEHSRRAEPPFSPSRQDDIYLADSNVPVMGIIWLACSLACDITIAIIIVYYASNHTYSLLQQDQKLPNKYALLLELELQLQLASVNLLGLILLLTAKFSGSAYVAPMIILSKVYANATMVLLNNRMTISGTSPTATVVEAQISTLRFQTVHGAAEGEIEGGAEGTENRVNARRTKRSLFHA
ncbi:hypothetical protein AMATHDRAFT_7164 [Amanita thiersii Skay4041]|uniref:DUF6534 domain-containing protein n=1 Tax=Amanita thiersii Skay4041 TaxID=703135 RepID=A0A2A9N918_9AGAR|nr:hypothetical protein AMATHDRAFT_7164 [Amanita thiersii Skay4041]